MDNIIIEKENGIIKHYGDKSNSPFICIKAHLKYQLFEKDCFIPVACGRYGQTKDYDSILTDEDIDLRPDFKKYIMNMYDKLEPSNTEKWREEVQKKYVNNSNAHKIARILLENINEKVLNINALPGNSNPAKPLESLRKSGLIILTEKENGKTYWRLIDGIYSPGFRSEIIPPATRRKALKLLGYTDALSGVKMSARELVVEHKFPEERWGDKEADTNINMTDDEIRHKFQLLTRQYNMVKREACKECVAYAERQTPFGISYFYEGDENWSCEASEGADAEDGCVGCGWYDMVEWKKNLIISANREEVNND